jgi:hypothetical protein
VLRRERRKFYNVITSELTVQTEKHFRQDNLSQQDNLCQQPKSVSIEHHHIFRSYFLPRFKQPPKSHQPTTTNLTSTKP